jgi:hypothetical protein
VGADVGVTAIVGAAIVTSAALGTVTVVPRTFLADEIAEVSAAAASALANDWAFVACAAVTDALNVTLAPARLAAVALDSTLFPFL